MKDSRVEGMEGGLQGLAVLEQSVFTVTPD